MKGMSIRLILASSEFILILWQLVRSLGCLFMTIMKFFRVFKMNTPTMFIVACIGNSTGGSCNSFASCYNSFLLLTGIGCLLSDALLETDTSASTSWGLPLSTRLRSCIDGQPVAPGVPNSKAISRQRTVRSLT